MLQEIRGVARIVLPIALAISCLPSSAQEKGLRAKFEPPAGKVLVFVGGSWNDDYRAYQEATGHRPAGVKFWWDFVEDTSFFWHNCDQNAGSDAAVIFTVGFVKSTGRDGGNRDSPSIVKEILGGKLDKALVSMAESFKRQRRPIFVVLGGESNHSLRITPQEFVKAYRYVHDRWDKEGVTNVAYVWQVCPTIADVDYARYYPGDRYVDWFASSYYGNSPETVKRIGSPVGFEPMAAIARQKGKPFMIGESGPHLGTVGLGGKQTWDSWFRPYFETVRRHGVRAIVYNNFGILPDDTQWGEQRIARMERPIREAWGREMKDPIYLGASPGLFGELGYGPQAGKDSAGAGRSEGISAGPAIDLLGRIDPRRDAVEGDWRLSKGVLTFAGDKEWSRIQVPYHPPEEYDLTVVAERVRGTEILILGLVVGGRQATVVLDGWGGGVSGLERIDGKVSQDNETTHRGWRFANGKPTTIVCKVRKSGVAVTCDGRQIVDWRGEAERLSVVGGWKVPDEKQLFLGGWKGGAFRFKKVEVREGSAGGVAATGASLPTPGGKFCPPKGKRLLIIGQDRDSMTAYVRDTSQVPGGFMSYNHLQAFDGLMGIEPRYIDGLHDFNIVKEYPNTTLQIGLVFKGMEREIARGDHDDRLDRLAGWFKEADVPVYLRVGPEFDLPTDNGFGWPTYEPESYKLAFRHIVDRFRKVGADNVAFVWHSAAWKGVEKVWVSYPGDEYVDWFAISLFGRENNEGAALFARYARQRGKPLMIAEATPLGGLAGTKEGVHTWEGWFRPFFEYIEKNDVRVVCFIPVDWESIRTYRGKGWRDARVQAVPEIKRRWLAEVGQARYLKSSPGLFEALGHRRRDTLRPHKSTSSCDPARSAAIKAGDVLVSMDGEKLTNLKRTTARLADAPIGKDVQFVVKRSGQEKTIVVRGE